MELQATISDGELALLTNLGVVQSKHLHVSEQGLVQDRNAHNHTAALVMTSASSSSSSSPKSHGKRAVKWRVHSPFRL